MVLNEIQFQRQLNVIFYLCGAIKFYWNNLKILLQLEFKCLKTYFLHLELLIEIQNEEMDSEATNRKIKV